MRFVIRQGKDPFGRADATLLIAMGLPGGGVARVGATHVFLRPGEVGSPNALQLGPTTLANSKLDPGATVDVARALIPQARRVELAGEPPLDARHVARALQGIPVTAGDTVMIDPSYGSGEGGPVAVVVDAVEPGPAALVGSGTVVAAAGEEAEAEAPPPPGRFPEETELPSGETKLPSGETITTAEALLAGLEPELEMLSGWLSLLTGAGNLPDTWGLPTVAGVLLEGPAGCGKSELVEAAAVNAGAAVHEVSLELVFKPERLIDLLEKAVKRTSAPAVIFVDRLDAAAGQEGMFRTQVAAVMRWFLDAVAERDRMATVLGTSSIARLDEAVTASPLLPRSLSIPPPDLDRRRLLFEAALGRVPTAEVDYERLAARSAGFSGADVMAAVVHASAGLARSGGKLTTDSIVAAVEETTPSLGSIPLGDMPSYGFERVANLTEVKQRLTESVIWPITDPDRFTRLGIEPPRGILLYGPPGTGKTFVIRALAHEAGAAFFPVKGAELLDKFVGESERGVREIFARARVAAPSIIFFDELDALAPVRGRSTNTVTDSVVAALLTELDGIAERGDVATIAATNRRDLIDPALLRAGRLEVQLELGLPATEARLALLRITDTPFADDVDLERLAEATEGLSFADLTGVLREAALNVLRRDAAVVTWDDLTEALVRFKGT